MIPGLKINVSHPPVWHKILQKRRSRVIPKTQSHRWRYLIYEPNLQKSHVQTVIRKNRHIYYHYFCQNSNSYIWKKPSETKEYVYGYTLFLIVNFQGIANTFLGNQRITSPVSIFYFWVFRFYDILTFERKFGAKRDILSITPQRHLSFRASGRTLISLKLKNIALGSKW